MLLCQIHRIKFDSDEIPDKNINAPDNDLLVVHQSIF